jgi:hypothetical protein
MSKKKTVYKPKYKGVRYIAKSLVKYQSKKYPNYNKALPDARKYLAEIKSSGQKVKLSSIWNLSRNRRQQSTSKKTKGSAPKIDKNLLELSFFFELVDYPTWIARCTNEIWFTSKIIPDSSSEIQGGSIVTYEEYFAPFVNFINGMKALTSAEENRYETDWLVTCTEPFYNSANKRWESKIITVDSDGNDFDYGFDPSTPNLLATKATLSGTTKTPEPTPEPTQTTQPAQSQNAERVKEIRGLISDLRQDAKDGLISKEDYSKFVKELTAKLDKGGLI